MKKLSLRADYSQVLLFSVSVFCCVLEISAVLCVLVSTNGLRALFLRAVSFCLSEEK